MTIIFYLALLIYVLVCVVLVSLILMQEGKGGGLSGTMGASMGETFGFGGASKQIRKYTGICATVFLALTVVLTFLAESAFKTTSSDFIGSGGTSAPVTAPAPAPAGNVSPGTVAPAAGEAPAARTITVTPEAGQAVPSIPAPADQGATPAAPAQ